jgi:heme/copper-type cytochrome/quinol oxidase subunit 2
MNLINIIYEPYFIIISISLIITLIAFFIIRNNKSEEEEQQNNTPQILLYTFFISFILLIILNYGLEYMNKNNFFQKGGVNKDELVNNLTIIADDIDCGLIDE